MAPLPPTRLVSMIPLRRCGSHAIRLRLSFSPEFYSPYPLHLVDFMPLVPLYGDLSDDRAYFQLIVDLLGLKAMSLVEWPGVSIDPVQLFEKIKDLPRHVHRVGWAILSEAARQHGARVAMDKSVDNVHDWPDLVRLFPQMLFVNLVRDPRAQVSSMNRAIIHEFDSLLNARILARAYESASDLIRAHPERVLTIRFEDFIEDQRNVLERLCAFLGLTFLPQMLDVSRSDEARRISAQSALWASNSSAPMRANVDKFKSELSEEELERIETVTRRQLDAYGYPRLTSASLEITEEMWREAKRSSEQKKTAAWEKMRETKPQDYILRRRRADYLEMCRRNL